MASDIPSSKPQESLGHRTEQLDPIQRPPISLLTDIEKNHPLPSVPETTVDRFEVTFDSPTDSGNPLNWSKRTKWTVTLVLAISKYILLLLQIPDLCVLWNFPKYIFFWDP